MSTTSFDPGVIESQLSDALLADPWFSNISVVGADPGDIDTLINAALQKLNLGVYVSVIDMAATKPDMPGPYYDDVRVLAMVVENPSLNRLPSNPNYVTGRQTALVVAALLHRFAPAGVNERASVRRAHMVPDPRKKLAMWNVELRLAAGTSYMVPQIAPVTVSSREPGPVTLGCATVGAPIFFTLDGSYPGPRNPTAQLYLPYVPAGFTTQGGQEFTTQGGVVFTENQTVSFQPLQVQAGQMLKARAWLSGYAPAKPDIIAVQY